MIVDRTAVALSTERVQELTSREERRFLEARTRSREIPSRYWIHDYASRRDEILRDYEARNEEVIAHFAGRPDDLLVLDVVAGEGWEKLCPFLGLDPPDEPFPHFNPG